MLRRFVTVAWATLVLSCFSDGDAVGGSGTGGDCPAGSVGCACYGNGSCDEGLRCATEADLCVYDDPGCTPGTLGCACDGGDCTDGSVCMSGYCGMGGGQTDTGVSSLDTSVGTTMPDDSTTVVDPSMTGADSVGETFMMTSGSVGDASMNDTSVSDASASASETGDPPACSMCIESVKQGACASEWGDCMSLTDCADMVADVSGCMIAGNTGCAASICGAYCGMGEPQYCAVYEPFIDCAAAACPDVCAELGCV